MKRLAAAIIFMLVLLPVIGLAGTKATQFTIEDTLQAVVDPQDESTSIASDPSAETLSSAKYGKVIIKNFSAYSVDIYGDGKLLRRDLPPGWTLRLTKIPRGWHRNFAMGGGHRWGPVWYYLRAKYTWKIY
jgi:hypothetical protein